MEATALAEVFGARLAELPVSSCKGQIGHTLGAAGAIEAAVTALAIAGGEVPPTAGLTEPDPALAPMRHVREKGMAARVRLALSNSFGFGGSNTVLAIAEPERFAPPDDSRIARRTIVITAASVLGPEGLDDGAAAARYLSGEPGENVGAATAEALAKGLDPERARRLDRGAALATAISARALAAAGVTPQSVPSADTGMVCGISYRREEELAAFLAPILEKGFRAGKPAVFPNLLLSSPAGHASIYLELRGPVFTTTDLSLSMGTAFASSADLLVHGEASVAVACTVVERDAIVEGTVGPRTYGRHFIAPPLSPSAAAFVLRVAGEATSAPLAVVHDWQDGTRLATWAPSPPPADPALVVLPRPSEPLEAALDGSPWAAARRTIVSRRAGSHEGTAGIALAAAIGALAQGDARSVLVLDTWHEPDTGPEGPGRWAAITLVAP
jgi:3-oxoacyl-[acyl-carrier-protein] synthase II